MNKLFIISIAFIALTSCQKETIIDPASTSSKSLKKASYSWDDETPEIEEFTYDSQGRVSVIKENERTSTFNYVSAASLVVTEKNNNDNTLYRTYNCTLNSNGYITKIDIINANGTHNYTLNYTYNADEYIIKTEGVPPTGTGYSAEYNIQNGNVVSSTNYNGGALSYTGQYTYDTSLKNKPGYSHSLYWYSNKLFGKGSKNMLVEYKSLSPTNTLSWHTQYKYILDADGYPLNTTTINMLDNNQGIATYFFK